MPAINDPNLIVGLNTADDAGVYKLSENLALVYTVDLLAPVVDDPYVFGTIAAANCISDIYAMGGDPRIALNVVGFPEKGDPGDLGAMLRGGQEKAREANVTVAGGHTFNAEGIMYGLSVVGYIHPQKIFTNANARPGDVIVLTKPIGVGTMIQAVLLKKDEGLDLKIVVQGMSTLNRDASLAMRACGANAATDITGYGLAGHLVEMAQASKVGIELFSSKIPVYNGVFETLKKEILEPGIKMNQSSFGKAVDIAGGVGQYERQIIFGSETSGGLAISLPEKNIDAFMAKYGKTARAVGRVTKEDPGRIRLVP